MKYNEVLQKLTDKSLSYRCIREVVDTKRFKKLFPDVPKEVEDAILKGDKVRFKQLFDQYNVVMEEWGVQHLKKIAQGIGMPGYSRLSRGQLLQELKEYDRDYVIRCHKRVITNK